MAELEDAYEREKLDHEREKRFNRDVQLHEIKLMDQLKLVKKIMVRGSPPANLSLTNLKRTENLLLWSC